MNYSKLAEIETKGESNWSKEDILLLVEEAHQREHDSTTMTGADNADAWKVIANKINSSFLLIVCTAEEYIRKEHIIQKKK